jgi:hypothetical protein
MRVICFQCNKQIGEKAPFSDNEATHALCEQCLRAMLEKLRDKRRGQKEDRSRYHADESLEFER